MCVCICVSMCVYMYHVVCRHPSLPGRTLVSLKRAIGVCEPPMEHLDMNSGPLQEQKAIFTPAPFLQPL